MPNTITNLLPNTFVYFKFLFLFSNYNIYKLYITVLSISILSILSISILSISILSISILSI